jgi:limonene-1,2-epoxide hydrolase
MPASEVKESHRIEARGKADFLIRTDEVWQGRPILDFAHVCLNYVEDNVIYAFRPFFKS